MNVLTHAVDHLVELLSDVRVFRNELSLRIYNLSPAPARAGNAGALGDHAENLIAA